jgi:hypothetical protein
MVTCKCRITADNWTNASVDYWTYENADYWTYIYAQVDKCK